MTEDSIMAEETRRPGRQWNTPVQGSSAESTELALLLRMMVNERGLSIRQLQAEMERSGLPHSPSTVARRLGGDNLENDWPFVVGVIEATTDEPPLREARLRQARALYRAAAEHPTPPRQDPEEAGTEEEAPADDGTTASGHTGSVISGGVFHGTVNLTVHQYTTADDPDPAVVLLRQQLLAAREEAAELRSLLTDARQRNSELREELHRHRSALNAAARQLDEAPEHVRSIVRRILPPDSLPPGN
ncbi:hypothetical protein [Kitasatospora sp. NPDC008115]|uniref:hypothetical protein n=1 Tax=Kitasatospora sp. NPDC008115 TaxID=3364022 RepID=UPI0036E04E7D